MKNTTAFICKSHGALQEGGCLKEKIYAMLLPCIFSSQVGSSPPVSERESTENTVSSAHGLLLQLLSTSVCMVPMSMDGSYRWISFSACRALVVYPNVPPCTGVTPIMYLAQSSAANWFHPLDTTVVIVIVLLIA